MSTSTSSDSSESSSVSSMDVGEQINKHGRRNKQKKVEKERGSESQEGKLKSQKKEGGFCCVSPKFTIKLTDNNNEDEDVLDKCARIQESGGVGKSIEVPQSTVWFVLT
jgi:hypothetical protein